MLSLIVCRSPAKVSPMSVATQVTEAARSGDAGRVLELCREANPFSTPSTLVEGALLTACEYGQLSVVRVCVLDMKCNPNCTDKSGRSPLHLAVQRKENGKVSVSIIKFLTSHGAKIRKSVLHVCCNELAFSTLVEMKADINARSVDNLTPIAVAVSNDRHELVIELIRAGCDLSPDLIFQAKSTSVAMELVRAGLDINFRNPDGYTPLQLAVKANDRRLARSLLEAKADPTLVSRAPSLEEDRPTASTSSSERASRSNSVVLASQWNEDSMVEVFSRIETLAGSLKKLAECGDLDDFPSNDIDDWVEAELSLAKAASAVKVIKEKIDKRDKTLSINSLCIICRNRPRSVVLMPCKHLCCCPSCSKALLNGGAWQPDEQQSRPFPQNKAQCPVCRDTIRDVVNVFT